MLLRAELAFVWRSQTEQRGLQVNADGRCKTEHADDGGGNTCGGGAHCCLLVLLAAVDARCFLLCSALLRFDKVWKENKSPRSNQTLRSLPTALGKVDGSWCHALSKILFAACTTSLLHAASASRATSSSTPMATSVAVPAPKRCLGLACVQVSACGGGGNFGQQTNCGWIWFCQPLLWLLLLCRKPVVASTLQRLCAGRQV